MMRWDGTSPVKNSRRRLDSRIIGCPWRIEMNSGDMSTVLENLGCQNQGQKLPKQLEVLPAERFLHLFFEMLNDGTEITFQDILDLGNFFVRLNTVYSSLNLRVKWLNAHADTVEAKFPVMWNQVQICSSGIYFNSNFSWPVNFKSLIKFIHQCCCLLIC